MKERTVNGMPIREVWQKLQSDFPVEVVKKHPTTKKEYIPVEKIEERLNEVVGMENWDFQLLSSVQIYRFGSTESCMVSGQLTIFDDERVPIIRSTAGASDLIYPKDSDRPTSVANAVDSAVQDTFKRCAKRFGIKCGTNRTSNKIEGTLMKVTVLEPFKALPKGGVKTLVCYEGQSLELVIWKEQWERIKEKYGSKFEVGSKVHEITFLGKQKEYKGNKQIEFVSFPDKGAA